MEWAQAYLGQRGLASKYLSEEVDPRVDPLSPGNKLIMVTGPLTGTMASTGGRYSVVTKSPLTGAIACSNSGGFIGAEIKNAGWGHDHLRGQGELAGLSLRGERERGAALRRRSLGQVGVGGRRDAPREASGPAAAHRVRRPGGGSRLSLLRGGQRPASRGGTLRRRHGDGLEEPQGGRGARHQGGRGHQGPEALPSDHGGAEGGARGERGHRSGSARVRHPGADERHQRDRCDAHPQHAGGEVRGRAQDLGGSDGREARERRPGEPGHQRGVLRLHHRMRAHLGDGQGATSRSRTSRSTGGRPADSNTRRHGRWGPTPGSTISKP